MLVFVESSERGCDVVRICDLVGAAEICRMLGVSRQRYAQLTKHPDFPPPIRELAMGAVRDAEAVRRYARERGREIHDDSPPVPPRRKAGSS